MHATDDQKRVPATVFACLRPGELRILVLLDFGTSTGWIPLDVPIGAVPAASRLPNSRLWATYDGGGKVIKIEARPNDSETISLICFNHVDRIRSGPESHRRGLRAAGGFALPATIAD
jgi:hypothetical protein